MLASKQTPVACPAPARTEGISSEPVMVGAVNCRAPACANRSSTSSFGLGGLNCAATPLARQPGSLLTALAAFVNTTEAVSVEVNATLTEHRRCEEPSAT